MSNRVWVDGEVQAAGGLVLREGAAGTEVVVVHRPHRRDWSFPKGHLEVGETVEAAAVREVEEETGLRCRLGDPLPASRYIDHRGNRKVVNYWTMSVVGGSFRPNDEVDDLSWLTLEHTRCPYRGPVTSTQAPGATRPMAGTLIRIDRPSAAPGEGANGSAVTSTSTAPEATNDRPTRDLVFEVDGLGVYYGSTKAVRDVEMNIARQEITAFIGPSGCGKSTVLRCFNRMNDLIEGARVEGALRYRGVDLYGQGVDPVEVRRRIGMVFQKPNPFPKSIYDNVAYGPRLTGVKKRSELDDLVESSLKQAALWDEVKDRLKRSALGMSGGQQQRLCIARAIAVEPEVLLMDEPCSALDPIATAKIEDLMVEIKSRYAIVIVTHNMQQAARVSDWTAFFSTEVNEANDTRCGVLVEYDETETVFSNPGDQRTENYITGRFG